MRQQVDSEHILRRTKRNEAKLSEHSRLRKPPGLQLRGMRQNNNRGNCCLHFDKCLATNCFNVHNIRCQVYLDWHFFKIVIALILPSHFKNSGNIKMVFSSLPFVFAWFTHMYFS